MLNVYLRPRTISARNAIVYHTVITVRLLLFFLLCNQLSGGKETNKASLSLLSIGFINIGFAGFLIIVSTETLIVAFLMVSHYFVMRVYN